MHNITLIPGDGIGPSVIDAAVRVIEATGVKIAWEKREAGITAFEKQGAPLPKETLDSIRKNGVAFKGPLGTPIASGFQSVNVALRKALDLYANVRPVRSYAGVKSRYRGVDLVVFRENTEEFYTGIERYVDDEHSAAELTGIVSRKGSERIIRYAFEYAKTHNRKQVTLVHKANILKLTHGLFLETGREIAREYPDITFDEKIVDNMCLQLVSDPKQFEVIVTTNLLGDILSDLCAGLAGGLGLAPSANIGEKGAIFEAVHGSAPDIAGKNIANPCAVILAGAMMLDYLDELDAAEQVRVGVAQVLKERKRVTRDLNPVRAVGTDKMADAIIQKMRRMK